MTLLALNIYGVLFVMIVTLDGVPFLVVVVVVAGIPFLSDKTP